MRLRHAFILFTIFAAFIGTVYADEPPTAPLAVTPALDGWKPVYKNPHKGTLTVGYERNSLAGWDKMTLTVRQCTTEETSVGAESFIGAFRQRLEKDGHKVSGLPVVEDGVLTVKFVRKDGSRGIALARIVGVSDARHLIVVIGEWPTNAPKTFEKDAATLTRGVHVR